MNLKITVTDTRNSQYGSIDDPGKCTTTWEADMMDCSVHAWFQVFESVLRASGYTESIVMCGACQLAFNDARDPSAMQKLIEEYDLHTPTP